jgi:hypothetical protein
MNEASKLNPNLEPFESNHTTPLADDFTVNYFNYFTEVEQHFARRRAKHIIVSPLDFAMIESWKDMGVPLHIILRAIDRVFDAYDAKPVKTRLINTIIYCEQEVMVGFEEYKHSRIGATQETDGDVSVGRSVPPPFSKETVIEFLELGVSDLGRLIGRLKHSEFELLKEAVERAIQRLHLLIADAKSAQELNFESLERELTRLESVVYEALTNCVAEEEIEKLRKEGAKQLKEYKKRMERVVYDQTLSNYVAKGLREQYGIPRLSLFYL